MVNPHTVKGQDLSDPPPQSGDELSEQARWLHFTLSSIGDAVVTTDGEGRVTFLNPAAEALTGWTLPEAIGQSLHTLIGIINEETRQSVVIPTIPALREGRSLELPEYSLLVAKDGSERPISDTSSLIRSDRGEVAGVVLVFRDVTERRKTEKALATALNYADDIIATLREPFLVLNVDLRVKTANRAFYDSFHVTKEETEDILVYDLGNGQWDIPSLRALLDGVLSENEYVHNFEVEHTFPKLGRRTMLLNARPFPPDSKHPEMILLALQDISALRLRADELAENDRLKNEFLAMLSHELRNPLDPLANAVHLLRLSSSNPVNLRETTQIIERQVGQLSRLVDDLLEVSRITTGKLQLRLARVAVGDIVERAVQSARPVIDKFQHELTVSLPPAPIWLNADAARLEQVLVNLLTNAAKYSNDQAHIWLTVEQSADQCLLRVRDTGVGIAPELMPRIFDLFTQAERSLDRSQGGLGIGLALVHRLVEMHGGQVEVHSTLGVGSEFVVRLPAEGVAIEQPVFAERPAAINLSRQSLRVLVVDDNVGAATILSMLVKAVGHDVQIAHDGPTAVQAALDFRPDVVLLDIGLPKMNGYEAARRIRSEPDLQNVVLVALTGYDQEEDRQRSREAGFNHHLVKPGDFNDVQAILATALKKAK